MRKFWTVAAALFFLTMLGLAIGLGHVASFDVWPFAILGLIALITVIREWRK
ncbi:hypothetical protein [Yoonia sp. 208BN28-4]|uniref:hypothetical protein n=1 Tax=Yoonia sp. 208BN28-4 TaxID=3126505 RepID=UPI0030A80532